MFQKSQFWLSVGWEKISDRIRRWRSQPTIGQLGEDLAAKYLRKHGYQILARGFHDHQGEIDVIATRDRAIIFVEVKTRSSDIAGTPASAVDESKQSKIIGTAKTYLKNHRLDEYSVRFDVIAILFDEEGQPDLQHLVAAFDETEAFDNRKPR